MTQPILTEPIQTNRGLWELGLDAYTTSTSDVLGATLRETMARNPTPGLVRAQGRFEEEAAAEAGLPGATRMLDAAEAKDRYGVETDRPISEFTARELSQLKQDENLRKSVISRGSGGLGQTALQLGVGLAGSIVDPLNIASAFIPVVPQARYAIAMARAETAAARAATRFRLGAIEGAAGAALLEPIVAGVAREEHADYTLMDSFLNVAFGTVLGGGLHALGGAVRDAAVARTAYAPPAQRAPEGPAPESPAPAAAEPLATMRGLDLDPVTRPADIGPRDPDVDQAGLRAALADLADRGSVRNADGAVRNEIERLAQAYGEVRARPMGPEFDPLVTITPETLAPVLIARGGWKGQGSVEVRGQGHGLVKFIFNHGEESIKPPEFRLSQEDVLAFPEIYRRFEPKPVDGRDTFRVERPSPHGARTIVYGVKRFDTGDNVVVTMHVQEPGRSGSDLPLSVERETGWTGSPAELPRPLGDTTGTLSDRVRPGRAQPAPGNLGALQAERNPATIRADAVVKESLPTGPAERLAAADEALAQAEADLKRALDAAPPEVREAAQAELEAIKTVAEEGDALSNATRAAAQCLRGN